MIRIQIMNFRNSVYSGDFVKRPACAVCFASGFQIMEIQYLWVRSMFSGFHF